MFYNTMKIYFLKNSGEVIWAVSYEDNRSVNFDEDYEDSYILKQYNKERIGLLVLEDSQYAQDFDECNGYRVNPETKELEFSYPDPNEPGVPPVYQKPLSEEVEELKAAQAETDSTVLELMETILLGGM